MNTDRSSVTNPNPRRVRLNSGALVTAPLKRTSPAIGGSSPESVSRVVVFPAPLRADQRHDLAGLDPEIETAHDRHRRRTRRTTRDTRGARRTKAAHSV